jgi:hypothetical protein
MQTRRRAPNHPFPGQLDPTSHHLDFVLESRNVERIRPIPPTVKPFSALEESLTATNTLLYTWVLDLLKVAGTPQKP